MNKNFLYASPYLIWMSLFFIVPTFLVVLVSFVDQQSWDLIIRVIREFHANSQNNGFTSSVRQAISELSQIHFTFDVLKELSEARIITTLSRTLIISVLSVIFTVFLSLPTAVYISQSSNKQIWLLLLILPFWSNFLVRIFMWIKILGNNGLINNALLSMNLIQEPISLLYNNFAVTLVSIYVCLPFSIIPIYSAIEKFDYSLMEASRDLGASPLQSFLYVFLPGIKNGLMSAAVFTFINTFGNYAIARLVGGQNSYMLGNLVIHNATTGRNMPLAAAISTFICLITLVLIMFSNRQSQRGKLA